MQISYVATSYGHYDQHKNTHNNNIRIKIFTEVIMYKYEKS